MLSQSAIYEFVGEAKEHLANLVQDLLAYSRVSRQGRNIQDVQAERAFELAVQVPVNTRATVRLPKAAP